VISIALSSEGVVFFVTTLRSFVYCKCCKMSIVRHMLHEALASRIVICYLAPAGGAGSKLWESRGKLSLFLWPSQSARDFH